MIPPFLNLVLIEDMYPVFPPLLCNGGVSIGDYYINHLICRFGDQEESCVCQKCVHYPEILDNDLVTGYDSELSIFEVTVILVIH